MTFETLVSKIRDKGEFMKDWAYRYLWDAMPDADEARMVAAARQAVRQASEPTID